MEPDRQIEIQLGHMCNNRCVFCVSGQRTARGEAGPMAVEPILQRIRQARELGHHKITLLGGEPTLQPGFLRIVQETVDLGFEEIVLFTNGAKTARPELVDAIVATGGRFTWRISIQGATRESHERTTRKPGSFGRIERTLANLQARGQRITVNMCVVRSNQDEVDQFAALLLPYGVSQLHLDMMRPLDAGERTEDELRATIPRYTELAGPLRRMVAGFPDGFDVNVGNLPYCVAPDLAPWIHHDGERTDTVAIDGDDRLSEPWNKYLVKRRDKAKPASCGACVLRGRCSGVFDTYARFYGTDELTPIGAADLRAVDPGGRLFAVWGGALLREAAAAEGLATRVRASADDALRLRVDALELALGPGVAPESARHDGFGVARVSGALTPDRLAPLARALAALGRPVHPVGEELVREPHPTLASALRRLRAAAPFGALAWAASRVLEEGARVEVDLGSPGGAEATLWLSLDAGRPAGGYAVRGAPDEALVAGLREALGALRRPDRRGARA